MPDAAPSKTPPLTYRALINKAWPIMLANTALPILGLVDTTIIGRWGDTTDLAALAVGVLALNVIIWNFGFLRMSTTGFIAQAHGRDDSLLKINTLVRASAIALLIAFVILIFNGPISRLALFILAPPDHIHSAANQYITLRLWAAPASLINIVISGYLIGIANTRLLLLLQIFMNGSNAILDIMFVKIFNMGVEGIALGTLIAEYLTACIGVLWFVTTQISSRIRLGLIKSLWQKSAIVALLKSNRDIWLRTLFLLAGFVGFTHFSGKYGAEQLAANHVLLQLISFSAFFLDGYANVTEAYIGKAIGQKNRLAFIDVIRKTSVLALLTAIALASFFMFTGQALIPAITDIPAVQTLALAYLPFAAAYIACSFGAFQLDGIFIGANDSAALRNASILATSIPFTLWAWLSPPWGMQGLWGMFVVFVILRAVFLGGYLPRLVHENFKS